MDFEARGSQGPQAGAGMEPDVFAGTRDLKYVSTAGTILTRAATPKTPDDEKLAHAKIVLHTAESKKMGPRRVK